MANWLWQFRWTRTSPLFLCFLSGCLLFLYASRKLIRIVHPPLIITSQLLKSPLSRVEIKSKESSSSSLLCWPEAPSSHSTSACTSCENSFICPCTVLSTAGAYWKGSYILCICPVDHLCVYYISIASICFGCLNSGENSEAVEHGKHSKSCTSFALFVAVFVS